MPRYDYRCENTSCKEVGKVKEHTHSMSAPKPACEGCGSILSVYHGSAAPVHYKGAFFKNTGGY